MQQLGIEFSDSVRVFHLEMSENCAGIVDGILYVTYNIVQLVGSMYLHSRSRVPVAEIILIDVAKNARNANVSTLQQIGTTSSRNASVKIPMGKPRTETRTSGFKLCSEKIESKTLKEGFRLHFPRFSDSFMMLVVFL
jgi:hypothetical protein